LSVWGAGLKVNKASDNDGVATTTAAKLDWNSRTMDPIAGGITLASLNIDESLDLHVEGNAVFNAFGVVVGKVLDFNLDLGTVSGVTDAGAGTPPLFDADAVSMTMNDAGIFVGIGGSLNDVNGDDAVLTNPDRYTDDVVVNGRFGFGASVDLLKLVSLKDRGTLPGISDDVDYLGIEMSGMTATLLGLEGKLDLSVWGAGLKVNKATDNDGVTTTTPAKLDWNSRTMDPIAGGIGLATLDIDESLDLHVEGNAVFNAFGVVVGKVLDFSLDLGTVSGVTDTGAGTPPLFDADAVSMTMNDAGLFVGIGGSLHDVNGDDTEL